MAEPIVSEIYPDLSVHLKDRYRQKKTGPWEAETNSRYGLVHYEFLKMMHECEFFGLLRITSRHYKTPLLHGT